MRLILLLLALLAFGGCDRQKPEGQQGAAESSDGIKGVHRDQAGKPAPDAMFQDPDGGEISLADFRGVPGAGQSVGDLVRAVHQGIADAREAGRCPCSPTANWA